MVTPTYNEADNIPLLIERLHAALEPLDHEIIVADDDSPDGTWRVAEEIAATDPRVHSMRRFHDPGLSASVLDGMSMARGDVLAVIDADLQHDESILTEMVEQVRSGAADVCVGSRSTVGGGYGDWAASRRFVSWVATLIARLLLRVPVSDPMSGYFVVSRRAYESTAPTINPRGFKILLEFIGRNRNLKVSEVGYEFANRVHGETKLNRSVIRSYLLGVAELRLGRQINPTFLLYTLVGIVGLVVNSVAFTFAEAVGFPLITTGFTSFYCDEDATVLIGVGPDQGRELVHSATDDAWTVRDSNFVELTGTAELPRGWDQRVARSPDGRTEFVVLATPDERRLVSRTDDGPWVDMARSPTVVFATDEGVYAFDHTTDTDLVRIWPAG